MTRQSIQQHEGSKYLKKIHPVRGTGRQEDGSILVDVYQVLLAFDVTCPARSHAIKKLLAAGQRSKGSALDDLKGAMAALNRAIDIEEGYLCKEMCHYPLPDNTPLPTIGDIIHIPKFNRKGMVAEVYPRDRTVDVELQ